MRRASYTAPDDFAASPPPPARRATLTMTLPPDQQTRDGYLDLIRDALDTAAARAPPVSRALPPPTSSDLKTEDRRWMLYAVSDLHTDMKAGGGRAGLG